MPRLLNERGDLLWEDLACTIPAYQGPIPEMDGPSTVAINLQNAEFDEDKAAAIFS